MRSILTCVVVLCAAGLALAQNQASISIKTMPPVVVKTVPQSGDTDVDPGLPELSATFSKDMQDGNWSWVQASPPENYPRGTGKPHYLDEHRTCVLPVKLEPGRTYVVWLNLGKFSSFMDTEHNRSVSYLLVFQTRAASSK